MCVCIYIYIVCFRPLVIIRGCLFHCYLYIKTEKSVNAKILASAVFSTSA